MLWLTDIKIVTNKHRYSSNFEALTLEIQVLWNENLTFYEPNQDEIISDFYNMSRQWFIKVDFWNVWFSKISPK